MNQVDTWWRESAKTICKTRCSFNHDAILMIIRNNCLFLFTLQVLEMNGMKLPFRCEPFLIRFISGSNDTVAGSPVRIRSHTGNDFIDLVQRVHLAIERRYLQQTQNHLQSKHFQILQRLFLAGHPQRQTLEKLDQRRYHVVLALILRLFLQLFVAQVVQVGWYHFDDGQEILVDGRNRQHLTAEAERSYQRAHHRQTQILFTLKSLQKQFETVQFTKPIDQVHQP